MLKFLASAFVALSASAKPTVLTSSNFSELVYDGAKSASQDGKGWFVEFYAPWCGHCKKLAPTWDELSEKSKMNLHVGMVDCSVEGDRPLCGKYGVKGYPTLIYFPAVDNGYYKYTVGKRDLDSLLDFSVGKGYLPADK